MIFEGVLDYFNLKDILEIIKTLTPYFVALGVYMFWHVQKEKEVLANESKNLIMKLNELLETGSKLTTDIDEIVFGVNSEEIIHESDYVHTYRSLSKLALESLELHKKKAQEIFSALGFLNDALKDNSLAEEAVQFKKIVEKEIDYIRRILLDHKKPPHEMMGIDLNECEYIESLHSALVFETVKIKKKFLKYALFRNRMITSQVK